MNIAAPKQRVRTMRTKGVGLDLFYSAFDAVVVCLCLETYCVEAFL